MAFEVCKSPISVGLIPYSLLRYGNSGRTILNPNISTSTNKNRETNGLILVEVSKMSDQCATSVPSKLSIIRGY